MVTGVISVGEDEFATAARKLFREYGYRSFPVVDREGRLTGVITRGDILNITSSRSNIRVKGIMSTPPLYTTPEEDVFSVAKTMVEGALGRMPVVKTRTDMTLTGVVSAHDIIKRFIQIRPKRESVEEIMTRNVKTCSYKDEITKVWDKMLETGFSGFPVVKNGSLIGMITRMDVICSGHARISREDDKGKVKSPPIVEKVMKTPVITVHPSSSVLEAGRIVVKNNIGRLPVLDGEELVGIVDREDLIRGWL